jgi:hypothetical protein
VDANLAGDVDKRKVLLDLCILWVIQLCVGFKVAKNYCFFHKTS